MTNEHKSTRLGDLLVERGIITRLQLACAVELQQTRRQHGFVENTSNSNTQELGELLIELGFINRSQLKSNLNWQRRLRKTTAVMVFIAPLLTAACGGGGGGSAGTNNTQALAPNSLTIPSEPVINKPESSSAATVEQVKDITPVSSSVASSLGRVSSPSFSSQSSSASSGSSMFNGPVEVYWSPPNQRENGEFLDITELAGYELRYKRKSDSHYTSIVIDDPYADAYYFDNLHGEYEFQIAAFDLNGVYSEFVQFKKI